MHRLSDCPLGIYEKALPPGDWPALFSRAAELGFSFVEMSIDESDQRLARLRWSAAERRRFVAQRQDATIRVPTICLSANRRFPLGSSNPETRRTGIELIHRAVDLADDLGIRVVQLAGYDVYYEPASDQTRQWFLQNLRCVVHYAEARGVMLSMEIMDTRLMSSVSRFLWYRQQIPSAWFSVYPDLGNLSAWNDNAAQELELGLQMGLVAAVHLKDTLAVSCESEGKFRDVPFGDGCVDFAALFAVLKRHHYSGAFLLEMWNRGESDTRSVAEAKSWIEEKIWAADQAADPVNRSAIE